MKSQTVKTIGGVMSAVALVSGGAGVAQAATIEPAAAAPASATTLAAADVADTEAPARAVEGTFSYTQDALSSNAEISGVFCKAAATLCASLPTYGCEAVKAAAVTVAGPNASFTTTVDELAGEEEATSYVMACSCATNLPAAAPSPTPRSRASLWKPSFRWPAPRPSSPASRPSPATPWMRKPHRPRKPSCLRGLSHIPLVLRLLRHPPEIDRSFERQSSIFRK